MPEVKQVLTLRLAIAAFITALLVSAPLCYFVYQSYQRITILERSQEILKRNHSSLQENYSQLLGNQTLQHTELQTLAATTKASTAAIGAQVQANKENILVLWQKLGPVKEFRVSGDHILTIPIAQ